jgi:Ca2+-transporting ATPase
MIQQTEYRLSMLTYEEARGMAGDGGLSLQQVAVSRKAHGSNNLTPPVREPLWKQYLKKYNDPIIRILLLAVAISAGVSLISGTGFLDTVGILAAILLATSLSFVSEYRSNREFDVLNAHRDDMPVKVFRDGCATSVPAREIVVGDRIILEAGDAIPADGWVLDADQIFSDESAFSGESEPVAKEVQAHVRKGTFVTAGKGRMAAEAVGDSAEMGVIAASLGIDHTTRTPLEFKLERLARIISRFGYAMAALIAFALVARGIVTGELTGLNPESAVHLLHYFMLAVVIIVVAVPEGLPMSVALSLSLAMRRMTRANCLVRRLIACETVGSATTICTDKTGTLTKNQMEVVVSSSGEPVIAAGLPQTTAEWITLNAAVNGTAHLGERDGRLVTIGNSTEGALLRWLSSRSLDYRRIRAETSVKKQVLFDSKRKRMSTVVQIGGKPILLVKGAPEIVADLCTDKPDISGLTEYAARAMRVLAFAHLEIADDDESETKLVWDGFVGIRDELRDNIAASVALCGQAGIRVRMVTGDSRETAEAIARETGILKNGAVMTGAEFRSLSDQGRVNTVRDLDVLARAEPMDKLLLVQALQKGGDVVAVTGDGINDAPALKHADVGLSMGLSGTEVAREASDIVILDDSFATITSAVLWGRSLYENIQRFLLFQLTINFCACILAFLAPLLGYPEPFSILQILWINIIMDTLAAFALCSEAPHPGLMNHPPVPRDAQIISPFMWLSIVATGVFFIIAGFLQITTGFLGGRNPAEAGTVFFTAFVLAQVWNGINCRAADGKMPPFFSGNPIFFSVMGIIVAAQFLIVQYGGRVFHTVPLGIGDWVAIIVLTASVLLIGVVIRIAYRQLERTGTQRNRRKVQPGIPRQ